jgi:uncharacterized protein YoxC
VIASKADKANNRLDTDTIGFTDIKNKAEFEVDSIGMAGGTSHTDGNPKPNGGMPSIYEHDDKTSNITHSAISEGELIIRDTDKQIQDINELSHDTEQAHHKLNPIFDKEKEQTRQEIVTGLKDLGALVKELKDAMDKQNNHGNENKMGSDFNKGVDSAIAIVTGMMTGDISGGLAGASAPWLAEQIKKQSGDNEVARLTAHAILGAVVAEVQGNSGLAGGAGAVSGELAAEVIRNLYKDDNGKKKDIKDLTEAEKQNISALSQLAAGLAAASMGGDVGDIGASIAASKNAVENNFLGPIDQERLMELRDKRDKKFLSHEEKIEMFLLDELDQKGDYLVGKYYKDPNSLTDEQVQRLMESLTRYYQQEEGMIGEEAAKRAVNDLLTGNWGYRAHNYDYPYLSYPEHKEPYIDAYWDSIANKSFLEKLFSARPQDENEQYFNKEKAWQKYMEATEWERQVGRPVMNFLPGGVGLVYNTMDTLESANALLDVNRRLNNGEEFNTEMALKLTDAGLTFVPVAGSRLMSKTAGKGTTGTTTNGYKVSNGADNVIAKVDLENPIVQSRINMKTGDAESGWVHVQNRHFSGKANASQFSISEAEAKAILSSPDVSKIPINNTRSSYNKVTGKTYTLYERVITLDKNIGVDKFNGKPTNTITILTDKHGNLVTATPGRIK